MTPTRPALKYHGSKWRIASWVISHFPAHRIYVEPFGGGASVLLRKPRSFAEVYNDLDEDVVNVFRVLREPRLAACLRMKLELTPWSRVEFLASHEEARDPVERARRTLVRSFMAHGTPSRRIGRAAFRGRFYRRNTTGAQDWAGWPAQVPAYVERLRGVVIECRPALEVIAQQDSPETLFYVDPPYPIDTRSSIRCDSDIGRAYAHDMSDDAHRELGAALHQVEGAVVLSGYGCSLYDQELYPDWVKTEKETIADKAVKRTETLWMNSTAVSRLNQGLFAAEAGGVK